VKILITGTAGFIGSNLREYLFKRDYDFQGWDKEYGIDLSYSVPALDNIDIIIHLAAETFVDYSITNPREFLVNNVIGTFNLLEAARKANIKKFIYVSTDEVYGSQIFGVREIHRLKPGNPYSASKACGDMFCLAYYNTYRVPIIIVRPENNYGRWQSDEKVIPTFIRYALQDKPLPIYGDGLHTRRWLYVEDFCNALEYIIQRGRIGEIYNIGTDESMTNINLAKIILKILNKSEKQYSFIDDTKIRPGHDRSYAMSLNKINNFGWRATTSIYNKLPEIVKWYEQKYREEKVISEKA
jgi:dTDP-glucose 4,6-dehydratase